MAVKGECGKLVKKNYKNLDFNCKNDYLYALYSLIINAVKNLNKYKRYNNELSNYLSSLDESIEYISAEIYEEWEDKIQNTSRALMMVFVDEASTGFSYVMFRKLMKKTEYKLNDLSRDVEDNLKELRDVRNWSFHLAQSNFVASKEVFMKSIAPDFQKYITYDFNPIKIPKDIEANILLLHSLFIHTDSRITIYDELIKCMVSDMELLLGQKVSFVELINPKIEMFDNGFALAQLSMAMQKRKYDGSDEAYEKITLQKKNEW